MIIFLAYEVFELIANAAEDVADPARVLTRAYYISVLFVIALYVAVAIVSVGSLPLSRLIDARDYALAEAARPALGAAGFVMIGVAAMLSTAPVVATASARSCGAKAKTLSVVASVGSAVLSPPGRGRSAWAAPPEILVPNQQHLRLVRQRGQQATNTAFAEAVAFVDDCYHRDEPPGVEELILRLLTDHPLRGRASPQKS